jgi:hypothetical protein
MKEGALLEERARGSSSAFKVDSVAHLKLVEGCRSLVPQGSNLAFNYITIHSDR